jgi:hypothetical protein
VEAVADWRPPLLAPADCQQGAAAALERRQHSPLPTVALLDRAYERQPSVSDSVAPWPLVRR